MPCTVLDAGHTTVYKTEMIPAPKGAYSLIVIQIGLVPPPVYVPFRKNTTTTGWSNRQDYFRLRVREGQFEKATYKLRPGDAQELAR